MLPFLFEIDRHLLNVASQPSARVKTSGVILSHNRMLFGPLFTESGVTPNSSTSHILSDHEKRKIRVSYEN